MIGTKKLSMIRKELASALATTQSDPIAWLESRISKGARKESAAGDGSEVLQSLRRFLGPTGKPPKRRQRLATKK